MRRTSLPWTELGFALLGMIWAGCAAVRPEPRFGGTVAPPRSTPTAVVPAARSSWERDLALQLRQYLGAPYVWGGVSPQGVDCSGLVVAVYASALNIELPHSVRELFTIGEVVDRSALRVGDLVFFGGRAERSPDHVGIYVGGGKFVHASRMAGVTVSSLEEPYYRQRWKGARRIVAQDRRQGESFGGNTQ